MGFGYIFVHLPSTGSYREDIISAADEVVRRLDGKLTAITDTGVILMAPSEVGETPVEFGYRIDGLIEERSRSLHATD